MNDVWRYIKGKNSESMKERNDITRQHFHKKHKGLKKVRYSLE